jgi:hypothetical protein
MIISFELLEDFTDELEKKLRALEKANIQVGWTEDQHYSGMSYADLALLHVNGVPSKNIPSRNPLGVSYYTFAPSKNFDKEIINFLTGKGGSVKSVGRQWAEEFTKHTRSIFGDESKLRPNKPSTKMIKLKVGVDPDSPMIFYGDLKDNLSYQINNTVGIIP